MMEADVKTSGTQPMYERFHQLARYFLTQDSEPKAVIFSQLGYMRALKEDQDHNLFASAPGLRPKTYCGLPYTVDRTQREDIQLSAEEPTTQGRGGVVLKAPLTGPMTLEVVGRQLTAVQLCDIIRAYLDAKGDPTYWEDLDHGLDRIVTEHGRFE